ncbi:D-ribitol-5-phosphate cytidylyltransferase [Pseudomonas shirazensis]|uniref:D-ribitol-5-phosphate cytidylyltransferase n=1 Tax=Pseudomonas shirazensis TaxID=2745494 RepID=UPI003CFC1802
MSKHIKNIAVILAGGKGVRSGFNKPKQLVRLAGKPILEHSIKAFQDNRQIHDIIVVTNAECLEGVEQLLLSARLDKVRAVVCGGAERYESSLAAIEAVRHYSGTHQVRLVFHDAVRPLLSQRIIDDVVRALDRYNAVDVVVKTTDTIIVADHVTNTISSIPTRANLRNGQTPQGFAFDTIDRAYAAALSDPGFATTDDCGVVLRYLPGEKIYLVEGESNNIKLTYEEDLHLLDKLCQLKSTLIESPDKINFILSGMKGKVLVVFGGSSGIGREICEIAGAYQAVVVSASKSSGVDIASLDAVRECLAAVAREHGRIDYIVNCAGVLNKQPLIDMTPQAITEAVQVNYLGAVNVAVSCFDYLRLTQGQLLNFASSSYTYGRAFYSLYSSSKAAVVNMTQALADEWNTHGVRVNCMNPGRTATPMRTKAFGNEPTDSLLSAREVAEKSLLVLASDYTGQVFDVRNN